jgi:hypothetical protein
MLKQVKNLTKIKFISIILGAILALFVSLFLVGLIGKAISGGGQQIKFVSDKNIFQSNEQLTFQFVYKNKTNIFYKFTDVILGLFGSSKEEAPEIKTKIFQPDGKEIDNIASEIKYENGKISLDLNHNHFQQEFKPGKYKVEVEVTENGKTYTQNQEFVYGVLAINTNKSIYLPNEEAYLQFAALQDDGHTICDANLKLEVRSSKFGVTTLSTEDGTIKYSGECKGDNVTDKPDYFAYYKVEGIGKYEMKLTNIDNGYEITDSFEVQESVLFDIERIGPTRIWPGADYDMKIKIKANQDFEGEIVETVPMLFAVTEQTGAMQNSVSDNYTKTIIWQAKINKGETKELNYTIDFPSISPYFYLIGPITLYQRESAVFSEQRKWQIASDATATQVGGIATNGGGADAWDFWTIAMLSTDGGTAATDNDTGARSEGILSKFDFGLASTSTITGIEVRLDAWETNGGSDAFLYASVSADEGGTWQATEHTASESGSEISTSETTYTLGEGGDLWGKASWTVAEINNFAVRIATSVNGTNKNINIDYVLVTVYYTTPTTISGTCKKADQSTSCANSEVIKVAVNGVLDTVNTGTTSGGSWSITRTSALSTNDEVTVFVDNVADNLEAVAVSKYDGTGDMTNFDLYEMHLNVGSDNALTVDNTAMSDYDNSVSTNEDIFFEASATSLTVCQIAGCESAELYIKLGSTYQPNTGGSTYVETHDIEMDGAFDLTGSGNYASISGGWNNDSTFTAGTSTIFFMASDSTETVSASATNTFNNLQFGDSATTSYIGHWDHNSTIDIDGNLAIDAGTLHNIANITNTTLAGNLSLGINGVYTKGSGNIIFNGATKTWTDGNSTKSDMGAVVIDGGGTIFLGSSVKATSISITPGDTLNAAGTYTLTLTGSGTPLTSSGAFTCSTSTVAYEGTSATTVAALNGANKYYNLTVGLSTDTNTFSYTAAAGEIEASGSVSLIAGSSGVHTFDMSTYNLSVGGGAASTGGIAVPTGTVFTQTSGTTKVISASGTSTIGGAGTTKFYTFVVGNASDGATYTFNLGGDIGASSSFTLNAGAHTLGLSSYEFGVYGDFTVGTSASVSAQTSTINLGGGTADTTLTISGSLEPYNLTINKTGTDANDDLNLTGNLIVRNTLTITDGELPQGTNNVTAEGSTTAVSVGINGEWNNVSTGDLTLGGAFANAGSVSFDTSDSGCTDIADAILIRSTSAGVQKSWTGAGSFYMANIDAQDQAGTATITVYRGTIAAQNNGANWVVGSCGASFTISGICQKVDQVTPCANSETIKVAYDGALQTPVTPGSTSGGSWSIGLDTAPTSGQVITVFVDSVADSLEANAVTKFDGTGTDITGILLYELHLTIGSDDLQTISNTNLLQYDNSVSTNEDIFFEASATSLTVCQIAGCESAELYIKLGSTYQPNTGGSSYVEIHDIENDGTFDLTGTSNYASISGGWNNDSTFTAGTSTIFFTASDSTETVSASATNTFNNLQFGDSSTTSFTGHWDHNSTIDINGNLAIDAGTLHNTANTNTTLAGNLSLGTNGAYSKGSGTFTFDGTSKTWTDSNAAKSDMGAAIIDGGGTISLGSSVKATSVNITGGDTLNAAGTYTLTLTGSGTPLTNGGTFTCSTSTVAYEGTSATTVTALSNGNHYYNLSVGLSTDTGTFAYTAAGEIEASGSVTLIPGSSGVHTFDMSTYDLSVGGGAGNTGGIAVPAGTVFTQSGGTTKVNSSNGGTATIGGTGTTKFYVFQIGNASDGATYTFNLGGDVGASSSFTLAAGTHTLGLSSYELGTWGDWTMGTDASLSAQTGTLNFGNNTSMTLTCSTSCEPYNLTLNKTSGTDSLDNVTLGANLIVRNTLTITDGQLVQGDYDVQVEGSTAVVIASGTDKEWTNIGIGDLTLGGTFANGGSVSFDASDGGCTDVADEILIRSTATGTARAWSGGGTFDMRNLDVQDQSGSSITITVYDGTDRGNTPNWLFIYCAPVGGGPSPLRIKGGVIIKGGTRIK